jgi:hypothetical protein
MKAPSPLIFFIEGLKFFQSAPILMKTDFRRQITAERNVSNTLDCPKIGQSEPPCHSLSPVANCDMQDSWPLAAVPTRGVPGFDFGIGEAMRSKKRGAEELECSESKDQNPRGVIK